MRQDPGFAATGAGEDEDGSVGMGNSCSLNITKSVGFGNHH
jgi:hypothetical protein